MEGNQFCLRWNNFLSNIVTGLESLHASEDLVDVTITCEGKNLKAHKVILSACSPYFRAIFKENPCQHPIVILKNVLYSDMAAILRFMYQGEVLISQNKLSSFLQTAELLQVSGLNTGNTNIGGLETEMNFSSVKQSCADNSGDDSKSESTTDSTQSPGSISSNMNSFKKKRKLSQNTASSTMPQETIPTESTGLVHSHTTPPLPVIINSSEVADDVLEIKQEVMDLEDENNQPQTSTSSDYVMSKEEQQSILERSLTSHSVCPQSAKQYALEHVKVVHETSPTHEPSDHHHQQQQQVHKNPLLLIDSSKQHKAASALIVKKKKPNGADQDQQKLLAATIHQQQTEKIIIIPSDDNSSSSPNETMSLHHNSQGGNCPHCGLAYSNQSALKYHVRLVHSELTNMFSCHLCPEYFTYREGYKTHMWEAHSVRH